MVIQANRLLMWLRRKPLRGGDAVNTENAEVWESSDNTETQQIEEPTQATSEEVTEENIKEA